MLITSHHPTSDFENNIMLYLCLYMCVYFPGWMSESSGCYSPDSVTSPDLVTDKNPVFLMVSGEASLLNTPYYSPGMIIIMIFIIY